ncbi:cAMP-binding domain of CRP or a regulatory subunit of cAMP-dependent protein kinases [bacterium A37T11]|nr:cAMP-binding domain of CRP or a regulatory subunit of cAMP-dependent protein kinases [bacterium A37T11]
MSANIILELFTKFNYPAKRTHENIIPHLHLLTKQDQRRPLLKKNDIPTYIYFPVKSYGRMFYDLDDGSTITANYMKRGEIMGFDRHFLEQEPAPYQLEMLNGGQAYSLDYRTFNTLYQKDDLFKKSVGLIQADQLARSSWHNELLKLSNKERIPPMLVQYPDLIQLVTKEEIAGWMGMSLSTFKRNYKS